MDRDRRKREIEEHFVRFFLRLEKRESGHLMPSEVPDFLLKEPGSVVGIEVRRLYRDEGPAGSGAKKAEALRAGELRQLAKSFYEAGGAATLVKGTVPALTASERWKVAKKLVSLRAGLSAGSRITFSLDTAGGGGDAVAHRATAGTRGV